MSRNYDLGQRDMGKAGYVALRNSANTGAVSFATVATLAARWNSFTSWAKARDVRKMENVTLELVRDYGRNLGAMVATGEMAAATAQNYVSAVNTVMSIATLRVWQTVSPTKDCSIAQRRAVRDEAPGALNRYAYGQASDAVRAQVGDRAFAVVELARELGLRSKEASLLNACAALSEARKTGKVTICDGTKGGRSRQLLITEAQLGALQRAAQAQGEARALIPTSESWRSWREGDLRVTRELVRRHTGGGLHDLRAAYACERYQVLTGHAAPCAGGKIEDRVRDQAARLEVSKELGHARAEIAAEYVGGRS